MLGAEVSNGSGLNVSERAAGGTWRSVKMKPPRGRAVAPRRRLGSPGCEHHRSSLTLRFHTCRRSVSPHHSHCCSVSIHAPMFSRALILS
jgi:hypothetical protein